MRRRPSARHAAVGGVIVLALAGLSVAVVSRLVTSTAEADTALLAGNPTNADRLAASALLVTAQPLDHSPLLGYYSNARVAEERAKELMQGIPLPPGPSRVLELDWEAQGSMSDGDMQFLLQFRAICEWVRAVESRTLDTELTAALDHIPSWACSTGITGGQGRAWGLRSIQGRRRRPSRGLRESELPRPSLA